jgi:hypothetical protein
MRNAMFIIHLLLFWNNSMGQQVINHVFDPSAFAIRGVAIPGMLTTAIVMKKEQANTTIPNIIDEEKKLLKKWRSTLFGNVNSLNALSISSADLINSIDIKRRLVLPVHYAPGFRKHLREFLKLKSRAKRLELRVLGLASLGALFIDGEGYYRVASQRLANEYIEIYAELSKIDFKLTKLLAFIGLLPFIAT